MRPFKKHSTTPYLKAGSTTELYCTGCEKDVEARLTSGSEMYPHRADLATVPFWVCDTCGAFVGTHHKTKNKYRSLGYLATPEIKRWRMRIHQILDPLWKNGLIERGNLYQRLSVALGHDYHTGNIYNVEEAEFIYSIAMEIKRKLDPSPFNR